MTTYDKRIELIAFCGKRRSNCEGCKLSALKDGNTCLFSVEESQTIDDWYELVFGDGDSVNHPAHYQGAHECIEAMKAMFGVEAVKAFCRCNAFKYRFRAGMKNGEEDIRKAEWYEDYLIKLIEQEGGNDTDRT